MIGRTMYILGWVSILLQWKSITNLLEMLELGFKCQVLRCLNLCFFWHWR